MKTYTPRKAEKPQTWQLVDATGQPLGRVASHIAQLLKGKLNPRYATHMDMGDHVVVVNAEKVVVTGRKAEQKVYYRHSGYPGGLKTTTYEQMMRRYPERIIEHAVKGMLPKTALGRQMYGKLRVYKGSRHPHTSQLGPAAPATEERV